MPNELKPCPFCGSDARAVDLGGWEVICNGCGASVCSDPDEASARSAWNRRLLPESSVVLNRTMGGIERAMNKLGYAKENAAPQETSTPEPSGMASGPAAAAPGWNEAVDACRAACLEVGKDAYEAAKAKDATDYVAGYQDASVDCDEALREMLRVPQEQRG